MECFGDLVKDAVHEGKDEKKMELLTFITNVNKTFQNFTETLFKEPEVKNLKRRSEETSTQAPEKKLKLSPSNFNLTCKQFHSLAISPSAIKSLELKLENAKDSTQYQEIVKVFKCSKTLSECIIIGSGRLNHIIAHALKSKLLKTLDVSS